MGDRSRWDWRYEVRAGMVSVTPGSRLNPLRYDGLDGLHSCQSRRRAGTPASPIQSAFVFYPPLSRQMEQNPVPPYCAAAGRVAFPRSRRTRCGTVVPRTSGHCPSFLAATTRRSRPSGSVLFAPHTTGHSLFTTAVIASRPNERCNSRLGSWTSASSGPCRR